MLTGKTAPAGTDFTAGTITAVSFAAGESTQPIPSELLSGTVVDGDEILRPSLTNSSSGGLP